MNKGEQRERLRKKRKKKSQTYRLQRSRGIRLLVSILLSGEHKLIGDRNFEISTVDERVKKSQNLQKKT